MLGVILSLPRSGGSGFGRRFEKSQNLFRQKFFGVLHRFEGAAADMRRDQQVVMRSCIRHERVIVHSRGAFVAKHVESGPSDVKAPQSLQ